jgi:hypothetical protein
MRAGVVGLRGGVAGAGWVARRAGGLVGAGRVGREACGGDGGGSITGWRAGGSGIGITRVIGLTSRIGISGIGGLAGISVLSGIGVTRIIGIAGFTCVGLCIRIGSFVHFDALLGPHIWSSGLSGLPPHRSQRTCRPRPELGAVSRTHGAAGRIHHEGLGDHGGVWRVAGRGCQRWWGRERTGPSRELADRGSGRCRRCASWAREPCWGRSRGRGRRHRGR